MSGPSGAPEIYRKLGSYLNAEIKSLPAPHPLCLSSKGSSIWRASGARPQNAPREQSMTECATKKRRWSPLPDRALAQVSSAASLLQCKLMHVSPPLHFPLSFCLHRRHNVCSTNKNKRTQTRTTNSSCTQTSETPPSTTDSKTERPEISLLRWQERTSSKHHLLQFCSSKLHQKTPAPKTGKKK